MLQRFYPDIRTQSAYHIDYGQLYQDGYRGIIFDIDNTLVPHGASADERAMELFRKLHGLGFKTMLLSNNKEKRVVSFQKQVHSDGIYKAGKPKKESYFLAMESMGTNPKNTMFVGDQLFTDIWGAKQAGIKTWLVEPIHPKEEIQIVIKRILERIVLYFYNREQNRKRKGQ